MRIFDDKTCAPPPSHDAIHDLIAHLYRASACIDTWEKALSNCTRVLGIRGSQIIGIRKTDGAIAFSHACSEIPAEVELDYVRLYHQTDPRRDYLLSNASGIWLFDQDVYDSKFMSAVPYYRDLLVPFGSRYTATSRLAQDDEIIVMIGFLSNSGRAGFERVHRDVLTLISCHLQCAADMYLQSRRRASMAWTGVELLHRLQRPSLMLGLDGMILAINPAAEIFIARSDSMSIRANVLVIAQRSAAMEIEAVFEHVAAVHRNRGRSSESRIIRLASAPGAATAVSLTPYLPEQSMFAFGVAPQVLMVVHQLINAREPDIGVWEVAFNLTPAQARTALNLYRGLCVKDIAREQRIAVSTVKSHIKALFAKTGVTRQAHLVRLLKEITEL